MKHQTQKITEHVMRLWRDAQQSTVYKGLHRVGI